MLCFPQSARGAICFGFLASELADKPYIDYNIRSSSLSACQQARTTIFQGMCENPRFSVWCHKAPQLISHIGKLRSHRLYYLYAAKTKNKEQLFSQLLFGAGGRGRTGTVKPHAPQTCASAYSATPASASLLYNIHFRLSIGFFKFF